MTTIELPDEQAAALKAKAAAQGLTLEDFFRKLAEEEAPAKAPPSPQEAAALILKLQKRVKPIPKAGPFTITSIAAASKWPLLSLTHRLQPRGAFR